MADAGPLDVLVTGAGGFVGQALARRLAEKPSVLGAPLGRLVLFDRGGMKVPPGAETMLGDIADPACIEALAAQRCHVVFHLASMPGGLAEQEPATGRRVNLDATLDLFDALGRHGSAGGRVPVVVFASSVAVYGVGLSSTVTAATPLRPALSYGAHKQMAEIALADATRRGLLDGRSLRLPGIVARPRGPAGQTSAFMSELLHALAAGEPMRCPVSPDATAWWMSAACAVDNLLRGALVDPTAADRGRVWQLPVLHLRIDAVVQALAERFGADRRALVDYQPDEAVEAVFGRYPPLDDHLARAAGFCDDGSSARLIDRALAGA